MYIQVNDEGTIALIVVDGVALDDGAGESVDVDAVAPVVPDHVVPDDRVCRLVHYLYAPIPSK